MNQDRSQSNFLKDDSSIHQAKPIEVINYQNKRYIPFFFGGRLGYYTDLQPIPTYDAIDVVIEFLCLLAFVLLWVFFAQLFIQLDNPTPLVYNGKGEVIKNGDPIILFVLPILGTFFYILLTILQLITNRFQYDLQITPDNARQVFSLTRKVVLVFKLITICLFIFLSLGYIKVIQNELNGYIMSYSVLYLIVYGLAYYIYSIYMGEI